MLHKIALGADHRGYVYKELIKTVSGVDFIDCGTFSEERTDYPIFARAVCEEVLRGRADGGVLFCGSGAGMNIAANRYVGIYAAVAWNVEIARIVREDDWCNVLVIPTDFVASSDLIAIFRAWQNGEPKLGRYRERIVMIDQ